MLDRMLDDDSYRREYENKALERCKFLSKNDDIMIDNLHKVLNERATIF
jgi:hypothetical protein